ncbi:MAG: DUF262 domain-containing protein [Candidatus Nealsonbacteria bacterium]
MKKRSAENISYTVFFTSSKLVSSPLLLVAKFQRNYKWSKKRIVDLINSIEQNDKGFYLGNIVIQKSTKGNRDFVIDGQQRLITLSFILNALKEREITKGNKNFINNIIFYPPKNKEVRVKFYRKNLQQIYLSILKGDKNIKIEDKSQEKIFTSYKIIKKEIDKIIKPKEFLDKIKLLEFVIIKCFSAHDVHQLFESLNSKAEKLSVVELTKNSLLGIAKNFDEKVVKEIEDIWEKIENSFEKTTIVWFDKFLRHQWFSIGGYVSNSSLFENIKKLIFDKDVDVLKKYSLTLEKDAKTYLSLREAKGLDKKDFSEEMSDDAWRKYLLLIECIKKLNVDQVYAVLLSLIKYGKKNSGYFKRARLFKDIEKIWSFLLLIKYSDISPSSYERLFANFCYEINNGRNFSKTKKDFFNKLKSIAPQKKVFVNSINKNIKCTGYQEKRITHNNDRDFIRVILMTCLSSGNKIIPDGLDIEHIIPKGNLNYWKKISKNHKKEVELVSRYKLGNLTLLPEDNLSNREFDYKYKNAYEKDDFELNRKLKANYGKSFNSDDPTTAVVVRGNTLAGTIYSICISKLNS